jgi:hypothetical protein
MLVVDQKELLILMLVVLELYLVELLLVLSQRHIKRPTVLHSPSQIHLLLVML